jgi:hypothetical protein
MMTGISLKGNTSAMTEFPIDWLGRCGPHSFDVALTPQEVREHLQKALTPESFLDSVFAFDRAYTGTIYENRIVIYPCKRGRNQQPNLIGTFKAWETGTRIEFRIEIDAMVSALIVLMPLGFLAFLIGFPAIVYSGGSDLAPLLFLMPLGVFAFAALAAIGIFQIPRESTYLLQFFLERFPAYRLPEANGPDRDLPRR